MLVINIPKTKTNTTRLFIVNSEGDLQLYGSYLQLRPPHTRHRCLFISYKEKVVGMHSVGKSPSKIVFYLGLENPEDFTGHCLG